jgi:hypothetical protein
MNVIKGFFILILMLGIILLGVYFIVKEETFICDKKTVYKYIPRTLKEEEESPIYVSEIFRTMFTQPSVWIDSINENQERKTDTINKYYISQM